MTQEIILKTIHTLTSCSSVNTFQLSITVNRLYVRDRLNKKIIDCSQSFQRWFSCLKNTFFRKRSYLLSSWEFNPWTSESALEFSNFTLRVFSALHFVSSCAWLSNLRFGEYQISNAQNFHYCNWKIYSNIKNLNIVSVRDSSCVRDDDDDDIVICTNCKFKIFNLNCKHLLRNITTAKLHCCCFLVVLLILGRNLNIF